MGRLEAIFVAPEARAPMERRESADLVAGRGIRGDRYFERAGTFSPEGASPDHELTLVALEEVETFASASGLPIGPADLRRNLVTSGVDLNALVGETFRVGAARVRGIRLCEPCRDLAGHTDPSIVAGMAHRAGLRASIVEGGTIRPGDAIEVG